MTVAFVGVLERCVRIRERSPSWQEHLVPWSAVRWRATLMC